MTAAARAVPLVSVVTRTKNRPEFLREALASVAAQTLAPIEHLVVNDGGDDVSGVIEPFLRAGRDVVYLDPGAVGRCKAANVALEAARGRWISWLDDDDLYYPDHLAELVKFAEGTGTKFVYSRAEKILQSFDAATGRYRDVKREPAPYWEFSRVRLWLRGDLHFVTVLHHREIFERLGGLDESLPVLEDVEFFGRAAEEYDFRLLDRVSAAFRVRDDFTNAVTALRKEFVATRRVLMARQSHMVLPELFETVEHGGILLGDALRRIAALEAEVARLKGGA
jgi:glycosyltransferase involved in cell wall biosynthesis